MHKAKNNYTVHKFGGTSLAQSHNFAAVQKLLTGENEIIVVSAIAGTTDTLQEVVNLAKAKRPYIEVLTQLQHRHCQLIENLLAGKGTDLVGELNRDFTDIQNILHAVSLVGTCPSAMEDRVLGYGELWSAKTLSQFLNQTTATAFLDASKVLITDNKNNRTCIDWPASRHALTQFLQDKEFNQLVVTGFIAANQDGRLVTLGRNGSDFSAAIFAHLFDAEQLIIWTDVDGVYSADPRKVRSAFALEHLSYEEAMELAYFGAKVIHPHTIFPAIENNIPIFIKNSANPQAKGTLISSTHQNDPVKHIIQGLSSIDNIALITIEGSGMAGVSGIAARVFSILHQTNISVILISQASSEHSICIALNNDKADEAVKTLTEHFQFEIKQNLIKRVYCLADCAILAAVGDGMVGTPGIAGKLCSTLAKANVNIRAIAQGSSERNISVVVQANEINKALRAVHAGFYLSAKTLSIGIVGPGQVGSTLLAQIKDILDELKSKHQVNLCVRGIINSKQMLLSHETIDLTQWEQQLAKQQEPPDLQRFADHIVADDMPHAVIIDCTANQTVADHYLQFMDKGIHIITPNKRANSEDINYYHQLKTLAQQKNRLYLYETTVCAGLPVIKTLQDLIQTGDTIVSIEGIVSGTLSYIFSELCSGKAFSAIIHQAKQLGYTEPDPRDDLSGMDVARKFVCLAREIGFKTTLNDIQVENLVPEPLRTCDTETFLQQLSHYDEQINAIIQPMLARGEKPGYVGSIAASGEIKVSIQGFPESHPFARLKGTDNMLIFHTRRYHTQPLVIQGPGAGTEVTAAGIFADLLRLVSSLGQ